MSGGLCRIVQSSKALSLVKACKFEGRTKQQLDASSLAALCNQMLSWQPEKNYSSDCSPSRFRLLLDILTQCYCTTATFNCWCYSCLRDAISYRGSSRQTIQGALLQHSNLAPIFLWVKRQHRHCSAKPMLGSSLLIYPTTSTESSQQFTGRTPCCPLCLVGLKNSHQSSWCCRSSFRATGELLPPCKIKRCWSHNLRPTI